MKIYREYPINKHKPTIIYKSRSVGATSLYISSVLWSNMLKTLSQKNYKTHSITNEMKCDNCDMEIYGSVHYRFVRDCGGWTSDYTDEIKVEEDLSCDEFLVKNIIK